MSVRMWMSTPLRAWLQAIVLCFVQAAQGIPTISVKGSKFFTDAGDQFYVKGVVYQGQKDENNLTNGPQCKIDAAAIAELGANVVSVYSVDPTLNHDACMDAFSEHGIYVIVHMASPTINLNRVAPEYTKEIRNAFADVLDGFQKYDNLLAFFAGNEVIDDSTTTIAALFVKAIIADMKAYRDAMQYRDIPIGYAAADRDDALRIATQSYFACGKASQAADFLGQNRYTWCPDSSFESSKYDTLYADAEDYPIPLFLSETGCRGNDTTEPHRDWDDQIAILGRKMNDRYSGSVIYEWRQQPINQGLVSYANSDAGTGDMRTLDDYSRLSSQWATVTPEGIKSSDYSPTRTAPSCPAFESGAWSVKADMVLPTIGLEGFTTPTAPRSSRTPRQTSDPSRSRTGSASVAAETSGAAGARTGDEAGAAKGPPVGAIVGGVLGGLVVLIALTAALLFFLNRSKKRGKAAPAAVGSGPLNPASDKMVAGPDEEYYKPRYHELTGHGTVPELDPWRGETVALRANEMPNGQGRTGELAHEGLSERSSDDEGGVQEEFSALDGYEREASPYVQAQRRTEMEWLQGEEERLRRRRELLMQQQGGGAT